MYIRSWSYYAKRRVVVKGIWHPATCIWETSDLSLRRKPFYSIVFHSLRLTYMSEMVIFVLMQSRKSKFFWVLTLMLLNCAQVSSNGALRGRTLLKRGKFLVIVGYSGCVCLHFALIHIVKRTLLLIVVRSRGSNSNVETKNAWPEF